MNQIERIQIMESVMDRMESTINTLRQSLEEYQELSEQIKTLEQYYDSDEWRQDFTDDSEGKLPSDLKRGVLSEDGLWNLLVSKQACLTMMEEILKQK